MKNLFFCVFCCALLLACTDSAPAVSEVDIDVIEKEIPKDSTYIFERSAWDVQVMVQYPDSNWIGTLLLLQGWSFPPTDWCDKTKVCEAAKKMGYAIVCPDMGKSIYSERTYAHTRQDWQKYPTRQWLTDSLIPALQKDGLFDTEGHNCILGLSTGARGAFLLALDRPDLFDAIACLSGDYDQSQFPSDNLYRGFFGSMAEFKELWIGEENPMRRLNRLKAAVYFGHGSIDTVVSSEHSARVYEAIKKNGWEKVEFHLKEGSGHDYDYWGGEVPNVLTFFQLNQ